MKLAPDRPSLSGRYQPGMDRARRAEGEAGQNGPASAEPGKDLRVSSPEMGLDPPIQPEMIETLSVFFFKGALGE